MALEIRHPSVSLALDLHAEFMDADTWRFMMPRSHVYEFVRQHSYLATFENQPPLADYPEITQAGTVFK